MKKIITYVFAPFLLLVFISIPIFTFAAEGRLPDATGTGTDTSASNIKITNPLKCGDDCTLISFITLVLNNVVMPIASVLAVLYIIWAGFSYVTAQGNPGKLKEANARLLWALIGTGVLLGAAGISKVIETTVNNLIK